MALIEGYGQGVFGNYTPQARHISGIKVKPYALAKQGILFSNGDTLSPTAGTTPAKFGPAYAINTPRCCGDCNGV